VGNYSQDPQAVLTLALTKGYTRVRFQQGKPVLDRELNLAADLAAPQRLAQRYIGNGTPAGDNGFAISGLNAATNDFAIAAGRALVNGQEVSVGANTTYRTQPIQTHVANLPAGVSNVYLHVVTTEVTAAQDADLANPGDVHSETAVRERLDWEVVVSAAPINAADSYLLAVINTAGPVVQDQRRLGLTAAALRDEVAASRGAAADLASRLSASLTPTGALAANSVATAQIADGSVQAPKLAAAAVTEPALGTGAVSNRTIANGAVTIAKMAQTLVFDAQVSVPGSPGAGQLGTAVVNVLVADEPAFLLISVHYDAPRPSLGQIQPFAQGVTWKHLTHIVKPIQAPILRHFHGVVIENASTLALSVTCRVYRLGET
jgi:hypothetical protein